MQARPCEGLHDVTKCLIFTSTRPIFHLLYDYFITKNICLNINQKLQVKAFAKIFNSSSSHFSRLFTKQTGHSPINYFIQLKIQAACKLLDNTDLSINDISYKMGFDNPFYFSRIFKKLMNMAPRDYRKR